MKGNTKKKETSTEKMKRMTGPEFFDEFWDQSWTYIKTVVDVCNEPVLILNKDLQVLAANEAFYHLFQVEQGNTEGTLVYELGNGQWDIPKLRELLEDILPKNTFFKGFEVEHEFPSIGQKTIVLNARHIYARDEDNAKLFPPLIMLAMDDVTEMLSIGKQLTDHTSKLEDMLSTRTEKMEQKIKKLEKRINELSDE